MKRNWIRGIAALILCFALLCNGLFLQGQLDPDVLFREAMSQANALESCESRFQATWSFLWAVQNKLFIPRFLHIFCRSISF